MVEESIMKQVRFLVWLILITASFIGAWLGAAVNIENVTSQASIEAEEEVKNLIVIITGRLGDGPMTAAGIVLGVGHDRLYIVTANHLVRRGAYEAKDLRIKLRFLPGELFNAKLLEHMDKQLDIAVLMIENLRRQAIHVDAIPFDRLGDAGVLERKNAVYHVGCPNGIPWRVNVTPDRISGMRGALLKFESYSIAPGNSGGGLFNARWELVGMIKVDLPPDGVAVKIQSILENLSQWGYPVNLIRKKEEQVDHEPVTPKPGWPPDDKSLESLREAADQGDANAQYNLARRIAWGVGVPQDWDQAVKWLRMAAKQGYAEAQCELGAWYDNGYGVEVNYFEALLWIRKAADQGYADGQYNLGAMYISGHGVKPNDIKAAKWFSKAAEQGHSTAQYSMGKMYVAGQGVSRNYKKAVKWYKEAAIQGHVQAKAQLGAIYALGVNGIERNYGDAFKWLHEAAEENDAAAQYNLGLLYRKGQGVKQNDEEAVKWFRKASNQHEASAQTQLGVSYANGLGVDKDYLEAVMWFRRAAEQNEPDAQFNLGIMYANGWGVKEDLGEAVKWTRKAADQGHEKAKQILRKLVKK